MGSVSWRKRGNRYLVSWRLDDGSQGGKTVDTPDEARDLAARLVAGRSVRPPSPAPWESCTPPAWRRSTSTTRS